VTAAVQHTATAARLREQADEMDLIAGVIFDASSLHDAATRLRAIADAKRAGAAQLDEMAAEHETSAHFNVAQFDDDGRQITDRCNCGNYVPCGRRS